MPRKLKTVTCESCKNTFKTSSARFTKCPDCRNTKNNTKKIGDFFRSAFGRWLNTRISQSGTIKVLGEHLDTETLTALFQLWKSRRTYEQLSYDTDTDSWEAKIELEIGHIFPLKGGKSRVGELTPRNLVIIPKDLNNHLKNKIFQNGYYVISSTTLNTRQSKSKLIKAFKSIILEFQNKHHLKGNNSKPTDSFSFTTEEYTPLEIARREAARLGIIFFPSDNINEVYERIFKGGAKLSPFTDKRPPAILPSKICAGIRLWDLPTDNPNISDVDTTTYATLNNVSSIIIYENEENTQKNIQEFDYITVEDYNFDAKTVREMYFCQTLKPALCNCFNDIELANKIFKTIDDCMYRFSSNYRKPQPNPFKEPDDDNWGNIDDWVD